MRCFVNVKTKREFEIFFLYCLKNDIKLCSGELVILHYFKDWLDTGVAFYFDDGKFDHLSYAEIGYGEQYKHEYKKVAFKDVFMKVKQLDIE